MSDLPFVTIAMPSYNEEGYIEECLRSLLQQDYPADRMEILVSDGGSQDRTREIVSRMAAEDGRVRLLDNSAHRIQSYGMNLAIKDSRGEFILVTDVHAEYANNYVSALVSTFVRTGADAAGGAQRAKAETWFQKALHGRLLVEPARRRRRSPTAPPRSEGWVDTVRFPGAFRRTILRSVGLYDVKAVTNEDAELQPAHPRERRGGRVYLSRDVVVHYYPRKSFRLLAKQYFKYGDGRRPHAAAPQALPVSRARSSRSSPSWEGHHDPRRAAAPGPRAAGVRRLRDADGARGGPRRQQGGPLGHPRRVGHLPHHARRARRGDAPGPHQVHRSSRSPRDRDARAFRAPANGASHEPSSPDTIFTMERRRPKPAFDRTRSGGAVHADGILERPEEMG